MKYFISFLDFNTELDVQDGASRDELVMAYLRANGGPEVVFNKFLKYASFKKQEDVEQIK